MAVFVDVDFYLFRSPGQWPPVHVTVVKRMGHRHGPCFLYIWSPKGGATPCHSPIVVLPAAVRLEPTPSENDAFILFIIRALYRSATVMDNSF